MAVKTPRKILSETLGFVVICRFSGIALGELAVNVMGRFLCHAGF
jgi:hypothetical protein